ncbi:MAG TPA: beta-phosphoglucomutase [Candidatus Atribacteria bacterium]|jgi:beta-phosphoglucomutase|nr:beta-phosphoglucomutase [Candidatus Atribacteria bacterium]
MGRKIKAVIFDLDGVITDTSEYHYQAWKKLADEEGIPFSRDDNDKLRGVSRRECLKILLKGKQISEEQFQEMMDRKNEYYVELLKQMTSQNILSGAKELVLELKRRGIKTAIASVSKNARTVLQGTGIENLFDVIVDGYSVKNTKPAPDLFLFAAKELGVEPEDCAVVEDAEVGIEAALAGKMIPIGIGPEERVGKARYRFEKIGDITLTKLLEIINF